MTVAMALSRIESSLLDAHVAFHLNAGVDVVIASAQDAVDETHEIVERYASAGHLVRTAGPASDFEATARVAATECAADWLIPSRPTEFWWPRGAQIGEVLVAVPPRYGVVQALVRTFVPVGGDEPFAERMTVRDSLAHASAGPEPLLEKLRPIWRLEPGVGLHGGQPLRAWYPFEVFSFAPDVVPAPDREVATGLEDGSFVVDERLRDTLRTLRERLGQSTSESTGPLALPAPTVVDDAIYAVECAAVGEVNLDRLDRQIRELEARLAVLESRFWSRLQRFGSSLVRSRLRRRG